MPETNRLRTREEILSSSTQEQTLPTNEELSAALEEVAELLEDQEANPFRIRAYRTAADTIRALGVPAYRLLESEGIAGLMELPGIGRSLAHSIEQMIQSGHLPLLERLRGEDVAARIFATVPDIGPKLAQRIHEELGIETLAELEASAYDGRLAQVPGMGVKRLRAVRESLGSRLARRRQWRWSEPQEGREKVPVAELLDVDRQYRLMAEQGKLPLIAPLRFNPTNEAWLPVLHTLRGNRHYTVLFSNTARAHELGTTHDWVIIYRDDGEDGRWTVVTEKSGRLRGRRIVRGHEEECERYYAENGSDD